MPRKPKTPGAVLGAGILVIIYGSIVFLFCGVCGSASLFLPGDANAEAMAEKDMPAYQIVKIGEPVSNLVVGLALILLGIGLLRLVPAARLGLYLVAAYQILFLIARNVYMAIYVFPLMEDLVANEVKNQGPVPFDIAQIVKGSMWAAVAISILIPVVFCLPAIFMLNLKSSRAAFAGEYVADPPDREESPPRYDGYDDDDDYNPTPKSPKSPGDTGITDRS